jgi:multiple sugar transport system ATP-binding protein
VAELTVSEVHKSFGQVTALDGMNFDVESGEFFCLLGPSASGKTTTLRTIAGLEKPARGRIYFRGRDVTDDAVQGRGMSMIFQTFALYPHLTVAENFAYPLRREGLPRKEISDRVNETAELLRVKHTLNRPPSTLSGGEQQRVAIGRAIIRRPALLLLDEPLTNLDAKLRHDTRAEFKRLHRELGMTMLLATPDQLEGLTMGQRIGVMQHGKVVQTDTPRALYENPQNAYVAGMVGAPTMNLLTGKVKSGSGGKSIALSFADIDASSWSPGLEVGEDVLFGIRPHDIHLGDAPASSIAFDASIHLTEPLGDVTVLDLHLGGQDGPAQLKIILPEERAARLSTGSKVTVNFDLRDAHLFYKETGVRIA